MTARYKLLCGAKCGLLFLLLTSMSVMINLMFTSDLMERIMESTDETSTQDDIHYTPRFQMNFSWSMLDKNFDTCLFSPLISPGISLLNASINGSSFNVTQSSTLTTSEKIKTESIFKIVKRFSDLLFSLFAVDIVLIEPSVLFCMLSPLHKDLLLKRNFYLSNYTNHKTVLTFGVRAEHVTVLEKIVSLEKMKKHGFTAEFVKEGLLEWMDVGNETDSFTNSSYTSHIFYKKGNWNLHLVVFYKRRNYMWHAALTSRLTQNFSIGDLYFTEAASAYENFTFVSLGFKEDYMSNIRIPSNPQYLLFEMSSSRFLECNTTIVSDFKKYSIAKQKKSMRKFRKRTVIGLQELKAIFNPLLMHLWIWSGTMLGWYRQCGLIPYTTDVDFAAWAAEVDDLDELTKLIKESKHLKLHQIMGVVEQALEFNTNCHGLRIDVFFLYPESNGTWYAGHRPSKEYYFKYHHPNFSLCSGELLGQKVTISCETEEVISCEYGPNWMKPVVTWNYERSIKNRGPNIYYSFEMLKKIYASNKKD